MNILMFTNTFTPHVNGVARSVEQFAAEYRRRGHCVLIVAPESPPSVENETDVVRIPAIQKFNGNDFSVTVPIPGYLNGIVRAFQPEIVHSHHPFILGDTALQFGVKHDIPIVFTHHTQYEKYNDYVPGDSPAMKGLVIDLAVGYCNLCEAVIAPGATIRDRLQSQGVIIPIHEIPTGVDTSLFGGGNGTELRQRLGIPQQRFVVGYVGRLAPEKGLDFLANSVARFVLQHDDACFLVAGAGPSARKLKSAFVDRNIAERLTLLGELDRRELADVYAAMDVFAFASQSETQDMVLIEAMAAGTPVVAVDAPGVREVLRSCVNGISLEVENARMFVETLKMVASITPRERDSLAAGARTTAKEFFSIRKTAATALALYERLIAEGAKRWRRTETWSAARRRIQEEWRNRSNSAEELTHAAN